MFLWKVKYQVYPDEVNFKRNIVTRDGNLESIKNTIVTYHDGAEIEITKAEYFGSVLVQEKECHPAPTDK